MAKKKKKKANKYEVKTPPIYTQYLAIAFQSLLQYLSACSGTPSHLTVPIDSALLAHYMYTAENNAYNYARSTQQLSSQCVATNCDNNNISQHGAVIQV